MGADAYAYLYLGVKSKDIFKPDEESVEYDLHDQRTGQKTGEKGKDSKFFLLNKQTGTKHYTEYQSDIVGDNYYHRMYQEGSDDAIIGVVVTSERAENGGYKEISDDDFAKARTEFEKNLRNVVGNLQPRLFLNLYWSY